MQIFATRAVARDRLRSRLGLPSAAVLATITNQPQEVRRRVGVPDALTNNDAAGKELYIATARLGISMAAGNSTFADRIAEVRKRAGLPVTILTTVSDPAAAVRTRLGFTDVLIGFSDLVQEVRLRCGLENVMPAVVTTPENNNFYNSLGISQVTPPTTWTNTQIMDSVHLKLADWAILSSVIVTDTRVNLRTAFYGRAQESALTALTVLTDSQVNGILIGANKWARMRCPWITSSADLSADGTTSDADGELILLRALGEWLEGSGENQRAQTFFKLAEERASALLESRGDYIQEAVYSSNKYNSSDGELIATMAASKVAAARGNAAAAAAFRADWDLRETQLRIMDGNLLYQWQVEATGLLEGGGDPEIVRLHQLAKASRMLKRDEQAAVYQADFHRRRTIYNAWSSTRINTLLLAAQRLPGIQGQSEAAVTIATAQTIAALREFRPPELVAMWQARSEETIKRYAAIAAVPAWLAQAAADPWAGVDGGYGEARILLACEMGALFMGDQVRAADFRAEYERRRKMLDFWRAERIQSFLDHAVRLPGVGAAMQDSGYDEESIVIIATADLVAAMDAPVAVVQQWAERKADAIRRNELLNSMSQWLNEAKALPWWSYDIEVSILHIVQRGWEYLGKAQLAADVKAQLAQRIKMNEIISGSMVGAFLADAAITAFADDETAVLLAASATARYLGQEKMAVDLGQQAERRRDRIRWTSDAYLNELLQTAAQETFTRANWARTEVETRTAVTAGSRFVPLPANTLPDQVGEVGWWRVTQQSYLQLSRMVIPVQYDGDPATVPTGFRGEPRIYDVSGTTNIELYPIPLVAGEIKFVARLNTLYASDSDTLAVDIELLILWAGRCWYGAQERFPSSQKMEQDYEKRLIALKRNQGALPFARVGTANERLTQLQGRGRYDPNGWQYG